MKILCKTWKPFKSSERYIYWFPPENGQRELCEWCLGGPAGRKDGARWPMQPRGRLSIRVRGPVWQGRSGLCLKPHPLEDWCFVDLVLEGSRDSPHELIGMWRQLQASCFVAAKPNDLLGFTNSVNMGIRGTLQTFFLSSSHKLSY